MTASGPRRAADSPVHAALPSERPPGLLEGDRPAPPFAYPGGGAGPSDPGSGDAREPSPLPGRTWTLELPPGTQFLTMNQRQHRMVAARLTKTLRETAGWLAKAQRIPRLEAALIVCELTVPDRRRRDPANWMPTAKACVDGLVDAGVLDDDDYRHVRGPDMRLNVAAHRERYGPGGVFTVRISELDGPL